MRILAVLIFAGTASMAVAQQIGTPGPVAELAPLKVTGSFQLQIGGLGSDQTVKAVERALLDKAEKEKAESPSILFDAKFWKYIPISIGSSESKEFSLPAYSSPEFRASELKLRRSEQRALFRP
jgi:hypothetical protein